ncbi:Scn10a [Symbiodinium sp. CCMP2592]|nr:Scn10a [Symbiodinium sp. CCMP2592]
MGVSSSIQPSWPSWQWPKVFDTSPCLTPGMLRILRGVMAVIFVVHCTWHVVEYAFLRGEGFYYFLFLTNWCLMFETLNMVLLFLLSLMAMEAPEPTHQWDFEKETEPALARVAMVVFSISQPLSLGVAILYWTLLRPIWDVLAGEEEWPAYLPFFVHGIDTILMLITFFACRVPYTCSHAGWVAIFSVLYGVLTYLHHVLRIGRWNGCATYEDPRDCPIYSVLDWNKPDEALPITLGAVVGVGLVLPVVYVILAWLRDRCDSRSDLEASAARLEEARQRERLLDRTGEEDVQLSGRKPCACLTCV